MDIYGRYIEVVNAVNIFSTRIWLRGITLCQNWPMESGRNCCPVGPVALIPLVEKWGLRSSPGYDGYDSLCHKLENYPAVNQHSYGKPMVSKEKRIYKWFVFQIYVNLHEGSHPKTEMSRGPTVVAMQWNMMNHAFFPPVASCFVTPFI